MGIPYLLTRFRARLDVVFTWAFLVPLCLLNYFSGRQLLEMLGDVPHHSDVPAVNGGMACFALIVFCAFSQLSLPSKLSLILMVLLDWIVSNTVLKCLLAPWSVYHIGCILYVNGAVCFMMDRRSDR
jgi:hypothetical protein